LSTAAVGVGLALYSPSTDKGERAQIADYGKSLTASQQRAFAMLTKMGFTPAQALGMIANFTYESGMGASVVGDKGAAFGLGQWHPDRQAEYAKLFGHTMQQSKHPFAEQIAFSAWELQTKYPSVWAKLKGANASQAAGILSRGYERPANADQQAALRSNYAASLAKNSLFSLPSGASAGRINNVTASTHINTINIHTQATDSKGIADTIYDTVMQRNQSMAWQANSGMN
jgi:hypothetical protein